MFRLRQKTDNDCHSAVWVAIAAARAGINMLSRQIPKFVSLQTFSDSDSDKSLAVGGNRNVPAKDSDSDSDSDKSLAVGGKDPANVRTRIPAKVRKD